MVGLNGSGFLQYTSLSLVPKPEEQPVPIYGGFGMDTVVAISFIPVQSSGVLFVLSDLVRSALISQEHVQRSLIVSSLCHYCVIIMSSLCHHYVIIVSSLCHCVIVMSSLCHCLCCHYVIIVSLCRHYVVIMSSLCRHYVILASFAV